MAGLCEGGNEPPGSLKARKNCSGAGYRSRDLWEQRSGTRELNVPALYQLSYPGTPPDTVSTFPFISTQLAWADETSETHIECTQPLCDLELWCRVEFPGSSVGRALSLMLAGSEFQSLGRAIVKEDEYEEVRWYGPLNGMLRSRDCLNHLSTHLSTSGNSPPLMRFLFPPLCKAPCKADLNNFKEKLFRGRVSASGPLVERTSALPTELPGNSTRHRKAPCKADLNNFKEKLFRGRVSTPGPLVERTSALPTELPGNSTRHRLNFSLYIHTTRKLLSSNLLSKNLKVRIYKTVILPVVLYGCETWTLTLREEQRLRLFENKVVRKIFGSKRDEVTGEWRKLHNALYTSPDIIRNIKSRRLKWAGHVARMGESRNAYRVLVGRPEGKRPLGRPRRRWEDNIKMDLREVGYDGRDWINLAQDRDQWRAYVRAAMNLRVP
ncbi:hypothetical protein ANN_02088 [Periplaneta americana]|uniref:Uncharacterized protein n=1 Tax=Periplaneta americana TaxID=6978 RepID=A0ABQ8TVF1_PERAM|nr:hypothetical protein ANN_02088 [Periplaneta americana]